MGGGQCGEVFALVDSFLQIETFLFGRNQDVAGGCVGMDGPFVGSWRGKVTSLSASLGQVSQHGRQDAAVAVVLHLDRRIDSHDAGKALAVAIGIGGVDRDR